MAITIRRLKKIIEEAESANVPKHEIDALKAELNELECYGFNKAAKDNEGFCVEQEDSKLYIGTDQFDKREFEETLKLSKRIRQSKHKSWIERIKGTFALV